MSQPPDFAAKVVGSYRYKSATPTARAEMLRQAAAKIATAPLASVAPLRSGPAKVAPIKPSPRKPVDVAKLSREMDSLAALADRAIARVRADKARAEIASLTGLDKARAGFKAQLANSGLAAPDGVGQESAAVKRSKPSQNPAFVPEPSQDVRLRLCNDHYREALAEIEVELEAAKKAGRIPQELLSRKARTEKEWTLASDKILGRGIRK